MVTRMTKKQAVICLLMSVLSGLFYPFYPDVFAGSQQSPPARSADKAARRASAGAVDDPLAKKNGADKQFQDKLFYEHALFTAQAMAESETVEDKLAEAHMKADFASLLCDCGERSRAMGIIKKSLKTVAQTVLDEEPLEYAEMAERFNVVTRLAQLAMQCDPAYEKSFAKELAGLRSAKAEATTEETRIESDTVPDSLWGTRPSARRELSGDIYARGAFEKIEEKKLDEAQRLFEQSLHFCVSSLLAGVIGKFRETSPLTAEHFFLTAASRIQANPSGKEVFELRFALGSLLRQLPTAPLGDSTEDLRKKAVIFAYLNALSAVTKMAEVRRSPQIVSLIKSALPLYALYQPTVSAQIAEWLGGLPVEAVSSAAQAATSATLTSVKEIEAFVEKAGESRDRDAACASLVSTNLYRKADVEGARQWAAKVSDLALRQELYDEIAYRQIFFRLAKEKELLPIKFDIGEINSPTLRSKLLTQLGRLAAKTDASLATDVLTEAVTQTMKLDSSLKQSHLLLRIAAVYAEYDPARAWQALREAVKSVNNHPAQPKNRWGRVVTPTTVVSYESGWRFPRLAFEDPAQYQNPYELTAFRKLAEADLVMALALAADINDKLTRLNVTFEICAAQLQKKRKAAAAVPPPM